ncbi:DUF2779 domain-containing protein [uncultured Polaribacter sp.]|uniref:DUF2779 domain-containing protein n=1 Tax=uncultured Polaribacter sp. TaxID=174711 RepID=UPI00259B6CC4|nr:DUF2779 domain-containing protein [uncultured Polaribacter sp.]
MRVLSKSRFKLGLECPNKLYYTGKKDYANKKNENPFLEALAKGGFQVEELARLHYPNGILIEGNPWDYEVTWDQTKVLLKEENIIIYEAAFLNKGLFIRADILVKRGNNIQLIEVKSKSYNSKDENSFLTAKNIKSEWKPYIFDIAFQKHVISECYPEWEVKSYIMLVDKSKTASIDGLNQLFRITNDANGRTGIKTLVNSIKETGTSVLGINNVSDIVTKIENDTYPYGNGLTFYNAIENFRSHYLNDNYKNWETSFMACNKCEFQATDEDKEKGLKSGFEECFIKQHKWGENEFEKPKIFDIKGMHFTKGKKLFQNNTFFMETLTRDDIGYKEEAGKLSNTERAWLQIEKELKKDKSIYVDKDGLKEEIGNWVYPLHFIDFETCTAALPFNKGRKPYEQIAFQFSHHIFYENGQIVHGDEYISNKAGYFPNYDFIRELKKALEKDNGTIFRFHNHENTILNTIYNQLQDSEEKDKDVLIDFIKSITHSTSKSTSKWKGKRDMVDLWLVAKKFYFNPLTKGSNSLKDLLPAALNKSTYLQNKYSKPLNDLSITSKNFSKNHIWLDMNEGEIINPYKKLPPVFDNWTEEEIEQSISDITNINEGGAALTAYGKLQYTDMEQAEIDQLTSALLKYCELDTLAMIMIYEHFIEIVKE